MISFLFFGGFKVVSEVSITIGKLGLIVYLSINKQQARRTGSEIGSVSQSPQIFDPRADLGLVLLGHHPDNLIDVIQIMHGPGGQHFS